MSTSTLTEQQTEIRLAGNLGFWAGLAAVVILAIHPPGTTELYNDGQQFLEHVDPLWLAIHLLSAVLILFFPVVFAVWGRNLGNARARVFGQWAAYTAIAGTGIAAIHLLATDTMAFLAFSNTFEAGGGSEAVIVGADVLLRLHAATLTAWVVTFFFALPVIFGLAARLDGSFPAWFPWLAWIGSAAALASVIVTMVERQWTTLSEMIIFRASAAVAVVLLLLITWWMRKGAVSPAQ